MKLTNKSINSFIFNVKSILLDPLPDTDADTSQLPELEVGKRVV